MTDITTDLDDLTLKDLQVQTILRMDRNYERKFAKAIETQDAAKRAEEAMALIKGYADALTEAGFPEIALQIMKVMA